MAGLIPGYETTFITRIDMTDDALKALKDKIETIIKSFDGEIVMQEDWGKRRLAYPIEKEIRGQYTHYVYTGKPGAVAEVERNLRLQETVLRFLTVQVEKEFDKEKYLAANPNGSAMKRDERGEGRPEGRPEGRGERGEGRDHYRDRGDRSERGERTERAPKSENPIQ